MSTTDVYARKIGEYVDHTLVEHSPAGLVSKRFEFYGVFVAASNITIYSDAEGTSALILNTDYSLIEKDSVVTSEEGVDAWKTYTVDNATYRDVPLYISMRIWGGYTQYKTPSPNIEWPSVGELIPANAELFMDGTDSFISSDGRSPVVDVVDYFKSKYIIDGIETDEARSKWPGQRGTYGFFGEYENVSGGDLTASNSTITAEGDWNKVVASAGAGYGAVTFSAVTSNGYAYVLVRKGNTATTVISLEASKGTATITWATPSVAFTGSATDSDTVVLSDEVILIKFIGGATGATSFRLYAGDGASTIATDYTYFKDWMVVDLDYPVPYTPGTHPAAKLQYDIDWATSDEWTISGRFYANEQAASQYVLDTRSASGDQAIGIYYDGTNWLLSSSDGTITTLTLTGVTNDAWNHVKVVFDSADSIAVYIDGGTAQNKTTNIPDVADMSKVINLGSDYAFANQLEGEMQDWTIQPTIDTSSAHYTSGLPFYDPNKTMGKDASWSLDKRGNFSGVPQQSGNIIEEYELDGQHVTKWENGRMEISFLASSGTAGWATTSNFFGTTSGNTLFKQIYFSIVVPFISLPRMVGGSQAIGQQLFSTTPSDISMTLFFPTATSILYSWTATGRWK